MDKKINDQDSAVETAEDIQKRSKVNIPKARILFGVIGVALFIFMAGNLINGGDDIDLILLLIGLGCIAAALRPG